MIYRIPHYSNGIISELGGEMKKITVILFLFLYTLNFSELIFSIIEKEGNHIVIDVEKKEGNRIVVDVEKKEIPKVSVPEARIISYKIKAGDTLAQVAKQYGTTVGEIVKTNKRKDKDLIYPGEVLKIPSSL